MITLALFIILLADLIGQVLCLAGEALDDGGLQ
jgi:hypothetical protein